MARVKGGTSARAGRKKILKQAEGYFGSKHRLFKTAKEQLLHSWVYSYRDRKNRKRDFRKLWIVRINAACRENDISYSKFINGLNKAEIKVNRKMLSEIAINDPNNFKELVVISKNALDGKAYTPKVVKEAKATNIAEEKKTAVKEVAVKKEVLKKAVEKKPTVKKTTDKKVTTKKTTTKK